MQVISRSISHKIQTDKQKAKSYQDLTDRLLFRLFAEHDQKGSDPDQKWCIQRRGKCLESISQLSK